MTTWSISPVRTPPVVMGLALLIMAASVLLAEYFKPTRFWADALGQPHYADIVPQAFGEWSVLPYGGNSVVNPVQAENLARLYTETLSRMYVHKPSGRVLMLSIAYGRDQSSDTQLHTPEQCYPSQGFVVEDQVDVDLPTSFGQLKSVRMKTRMSERVEPLTFFIRVGDKVVRGSRERNLARLGMGVKGYLVDGMLLRVSEITRQADPSFALQAQFVQDLLNAVGPQGRRTLIGEPVEP
jgi:EpsI family protein